MSTKDREGTDPTPISLNQSLTLYMLGEESVLFSKQSLQLYGLDRTTTLIALMLSEGTTPEAAAKKLSLPGEAFQAVFDLSALLNGKEETTKGYETNFLCSREVSVHKLDAPVYRMLNTDFIVQGPEEFLRKWVFPWINHLELQSGAEPNLVISIEPDGNSYRFSMNNTLQGGSLPPEQLLPVLQGKLRQFSYQRLDYLIAIHGAVVTDGAQTLMLAGLSGSGKSTLAAALLSRGYRLISDEPAVVDPLSGGAWPIPLGLGLKAGSWQAALVDYPSLNSHPIHVRWDGQPIRYLFLDAIHMDTESFARPVTNLIFPRYDVDSAGSITPLTPVQGLRAMTEAGYQVTGLDEKRVVQILDWVNGLSCCSLVYSSTDEALGLLKGVLQGQQIQPLFAGNGEVVR